MKHEITRVRHDIKRRSLTIRAKEYITPAMLRLTLGGEELEGFTSLGADDHIKIFVQGESDAVEKRDYTPRKFDAQKNELLVDFAVHEAGPATNWAVNANIGDTAYIGGPRGSMIVANDFDWYLLIGDETALPAIGRRVEELPERATVITLTAVTGTAEEQQFSTKARHKALWAHRAAASADDPAPLLEMLKSIALPEGDGFIWIAAESKVARGLREYVLKVMQHPAEWLKASGYWAKGEPDAHEKIAD